MSKHQLFGCDYYPEHWPEERQEKDFKMMKDAGITAVRIAEFAWSRMEPKPGKYKFDWLDKVVKQLYTYGIKTIMGTPTGASPQWLFQAHPEMVTVNYDGSPDAQGGRYVSCINDEIFRDKARAIVRELAEHFVGRKEIVGWHLHNEFSARRCYCTRCVREFREWLRDKYKTLSALNTAWGTVFWSFEFTDWTQIPGPGITNGGQYGNLELDYHRFYSDSIIDFAREQAEIIRNLNKDELITTNFQRFEKRELDYRKAAKVIDIVGSNNYPTAEEFYANHDLLRGLKDKKYWIYEQRSGAPGRTDVESISPYLDEKQIRLWTWQSISHGAESIFYFRWRTCLSGQEMYWHGILDHDGEPNSRYFLVQEIGREFDKIKPIIREGKINSPVAVFFDYEQRWSMNLETEPRRKMNLKYEELINNWYYSFTNKGINVDFVFSDSDFNGYKIIVLPALYMEDPELVEKLYTYVENGGTILVTFPATTVDLSRKALDCKKPGKLGELLGIDIREYGNMGDKIKSVEFSEQEFELRRWFEVIKCNSAKTVINIEESSRPVLTKNEEGGGKAWYLGYDCEIKLINKIVDMFISELLIDKIDMGGQDVEVVTWLYRDENILFVLNHEECEVTVNLGDKYISCLNDRVFDRELTLTGYDIEIIKRK